MPPVFTLGNQRIHRLSYRTVSEWSVTGQSMEGGTLSTHAGRSVASRDDSFPVSFLTYVL